MHTVTALTQQFVFTVAMRRSVWTTNSGELVNHTPAPLCEKEHYYHGELCGVAGFDCYKRRCDTYTTATHCWQLVWGIWPVKLIQNAYLFAVLAPRWWNELPITPNCFSHTHTTWTDCQCVPLKIHCLLSSYVSLNIKCSVCDTAQPFLHLELSDIPVSPTDKIRTVEQCQH